MNDIDKLCQQYLHILYQDVQIKHANDMQNMVKTYGEILYPSVDKILAAVPLTAEDVFWDLGSGVGKLVMQFFLKSPVREACGVEIIPELHEQAIRAAEQVHAELPGFYTDGRKLSFILGDFLETPLTAPTVVFLCSPCYSPEMLEAISKIINVTSSIQTVLTLRPLAHLSRFTFKKAIHIECSWDSALCYVYK